MSDKPKGLLGVIAEHQDVHHYQDLLWEGSFGDYLDIVRQDGSVARNAYQRLYDLIESYGSRRSTPSTASPSCGHRFFDDPFDNGADAVFGIDIHLMKLVRVFRAPPQLGYGPEKRVILLHGPVGSAKSTIARLLKKGLEAVQSHRRRPALHLLLGRRRRRSDPLADERRAAQAPCPTPPGGGAEGATPSPRATRRYPIRIQGELNPVCRYWYRELMRRYNGDFLKVQEHIKVRRLLLSEKDRVGIGTFQPKDEKNQDSTELTGDINYRKIAEFGSDSDPRAFNFDGEFCVANRGIIEFVEMLKLDVAFLYDLLGASQEHRIKPKKFAQTSIDEVIIGHTNEPEYRRLQNNEYMEALRDRTIKIDVPYITKASQERQDLRQGLQQAKKVSAHIAPAHGRDGGAVGSAHPARGAVQPQALAAPEVEALRRSFGARVHRRPRQGAAQGAVTREGMMGISPALRAGQDLQRARERPRPRTVLNPFMVFNELESGLKSHSLISNEDERERYRELLGVVKEEYTDIVKNEVQKAIAADEGALQPAVRKLHRQPSGVCAQGEGARTPSPASTRSPMSD